MRILCAESCIAEDAVYFGCGSMTGSMTGMLSVVAFRIPTDSSLSFINQIWSGLH